jgi:RNA polymerase sigma-70 factor (ECF subfamily)
MVPTNAPEDEALIIAGWKNGDEEAFKRLVDKYQKRVIAVAYRFLLNAMEAEDVAQEAFFKLHQARNRYQHQSKFSAFLFTLVNRLCLNALRHRRRHPTQSLHDDRKETDESAPLQWQDPKAATAVQILEARERQVLVLRAVENLTADERMAVILDHWESQSLEAIAQVLHKSVPAVKSILFRARTKLRERLKTYFLA